MIIKINDEKNVLKFKLKRKIYIKKWKLLNPNYYKNYYKLNYKPIIRKKKKCKICADFFIGKNNTRKICYKKCCKNVYSENSIKKLRITKSDDKIFGKIYFNKIRLLKIPYDLKNNTKLTLKNIKKIKELKEKNISVLEIHKLFPFVSVSTIKYHYYPNSKRFALESYNRNYFKRDKSKMSSVSKKSKERKLMLFKDKKLIDNKNNYWT